MSIADTQPKTAEELLAYAVNIQAQTMAYRGIAPEVITREAKALETAIRPELWRRIRRPGVAA
jgi:hypothetical protein